MEKERLHYIDVAKGLLILMVVYGHLYGVTSGINIVGASIIHQSCNLFVSFYMPCFFIITGYCSNFDKSFFDILTTSFKTILFPGIILSFIRMLLYNFSIENFISYIYDLFFFGGKYWFLTALFLARIIFWGVYYYCRERSNVICVLSFVMGYLLGIYYQGIEYWWFIHVLLLMPYLALGRYMKKNGFLGRCNLNTTTIAFVVFFCVTVFLCHKGILQRDYFYHVPGITEKLLEANISMFVPLVLLSISGSLWLLSISIAISHNRLLEYYGKNSLVVYCVHGAILQYVIPKVGGGNYNVQEYLSVMIIAYLFVLFVCGVIAYLFNLKYLRVFIGKF